MPTTSLREISLLRRLKHDNIIHLRDVACIKGTIFLVFDYASQDLSKYIKLHRSKQAGIGMRRSKEFLKQLASALAYCHGTGVMHRDLKPSNILICEHEQLKLADFGLARTFSIHHDSTDMTHE